MTVFYCEKWFLPGKRAIRPLDEAEAQRRHDAREPYTALIGSQDHPSQVISLAGPWASVGFMDDAVREYLAYDFNEKQRGKLFLTMALYRKFEGDSDDPVAFGQFAFQQNGHVIMEWRDLRSGEAVQKERDVNVSSNWEDYPNFGYYVPLIKKERGINLSEI
jgi:hypothetical protein